MGFLHSVPEKSKEPRYKAFERLKQPQDLPQNDDYLISDFFEIGPARQSEMGDLPFRDQEIWYFSQNTEIEYDRFERSALIDMSAAYCVAKLDGKEPNAIAPVHQSDNPEQDQVSAIARGFGSVLRSAAKGGANDG